MQKILRKKVCNIGLKIREGGCPLRVKLGGIFLAGVVKMLETSFLAGSSFPGRFVKKVSTGICMIQCIVSLCRCCDEQGRSEAVLDGVVFPDASVDFTIPLRCPPHGRYCTSHGGEDEALIMFGPVRSWIFYFFYFFFPERFGNEYFSVSTSCKIGTPMKTVAKGHWQKELGVRRHR